MIAGSDIRAEALRLQAGFITAGAVVLENTVVPSGTIWAGVPARQVKQMDPDVLGKRTALTAEAYVKYKDWYQAPQMPEG